MHCSTICKVWPYWFKREHGWYLHKTSWQCRFSLSYWQIHFQKTPKISKTKEWLKGSDKLNTKNWSLWTCWVCPGSKDQCQCLQFDSSLLINQTNVHLGTCVSVTVVEYWDITTHICCDLYFPIFHTEYCEDIQLSVIKRSQSYIQICYTFSFSWLIHSTIMRLPIDLLFEDSRPTASLNATLTVFPGNGRTEAPELE